MNKNKLAIIMDSLSLSFIIFILFFTWISRLINDYKISIISSCLISILSLIIIAYLFLKRNNKNKYSYIDKLNQEKCEKQLKYNDIKTNINYFEKLLSAKFIEHNIYQNEKAIFYINLIGKLDCYDFYLANNFFKTSKEKLPLSFICNLKSEDFSAILSNSPIKFDVFSFEDLYELMKNKNYFPIELSKNSSKYKFSLTNFLNKLKTFLQKTKNILANLKFRSTFFTGLSLVILSAFVPFSLYYLIVGSCLLVISFISIFIKAKPKDISKNQDKSLKYLCN